MDAMPDLSAPRPLATTIHPLAVVDPAARLGVGVSIGPFCTVGPDVTIEDGADPVEVAAPSLAYAMGPPLGCASQSM